MYETIRIVLYDVEWQIMRMQALPVRQRDGGWRTLEGTKANLDVFLAYLMQAENPDEAEARKYRIATTLSSASTNNKRMGLQDSEMHALVLVVEKRCSNYKRSSVVRVAKEWNWKKVAADLTELWRNDPDLLRALYREFDHRKKAKRYNSGKPELTTFVAYAKGVMAGHDYREL